MRSVTPNTLEWQSLATDNQVPASCWRITRIRRMYPSSRRCLQITHQRNLTDVIPYRNHECRRTGWSLTTLTRTSRLTLSIDLPATRLESRRENATRKVAVDVQRRRGTHVARPVKFSSRLRERVPSASSDGCSWHESLLVFEQITG